MIDEEKSRHSHRLRDLAGSEHDDDAIPNMEKIVKAASGAYNAIILTNTHFQGHTLIAMMFAEIHCIDVHGGTPKLDLERFNALSRDEKLRDVKGLLYSVGGMIESIAKVGKGLSNFAETLIDLEEQLSKGDMIVLKKDIIKEIDIGPPLNPLPD